MRITAKLAWKQMKRNRCRTIGAIAAILLSTALTTAVFCFVTSADAMLVSFLGEGYGEYAGAYQSLLLIPAVFFAGLIFIMSVTAISCIRGVKEVGVLTDVHTRKWVKICFGFEGVLADRNISRNKMSFQPTIRALSLGILLLLCTGSMVLQVQQLKAYMNPGTDDVMMNYSSNRRHQVNEVTGRTEEILAKPIQSQEAEQVRQRLLEYGNIEITGVGCDNGRYYVAMDTEPIDAFLPESHVPSHVLALNEKPIRLVVPEAELRFYDWYCKPENELVYMQYAKTVGEEFFPAVTEDSYAKEGFVVRVSRTDTMVQVLNIAVVVAEIIIYGFVGVLLLIGLVSVISTLSTNIMMRAREFAVLKSVGMTTEGLQKMLFCESVLCTLRATAWGVPLGILIPYMINLVLRQAAPVLYEIPWGLLLFSIGSIFALILIVTFGTVYKLRGQKLIESIRMKTD